MRRARNERQAEAAAAVRSSCQFRVLGDRSDRN